MLTDHAAVRDARPPEVQSTAVRLLGLNGILGLALYSLAAATAAHGQASADPVLDAARSAVKKAWETEIQPFTESSLTKIEIHAVQRRDRLATGHEISLAHAYVETSWWKDSRHYLLLMRPSQAGYEVLYRFDGGTHGKGIKYRLVDLGSGTRRFALEISDDGFDEAITGTWTVLVMYLPESDRFAEVFRELTTYRPRTGHRYGSTHFYRQAEGPMKEIVVRTELLQDQRVVDSVESIFVWQGSAYEGTMPLPELWRAVLPSTIKRSP